MRQTYLTVLGGRTRVVPRQTRSWAYLPDHVALAQDAFIPRHGGRFLRRDERPAVGDFTFWNGDFHPFGWERLTQERFGDYDFWGVSQEYIAKIWCPTTVTLRP